jgi:hypothetical protein
MFLFVGVCAGALQEACDIRLLLACPLRRVLAAYIGNVQCSYFHLLRYVEASHVCVLGAFETFQVAEIISCVIPDQYKNLSSEHAFLPDAVTKHCFLAAFSGTRISFALFFA